MLAYAVRLYLLILSWYFLFSWYNAWIQVLFAKNSFSLTLAWLIRIDFCMIYIFLYSNHFYISGIFHTIYVFVWKTFYGLSYPGGKVFLVSYFIFKIGKDSLYKEKNISKNLVQPSLGSWKCFTSSQFISHDIKLNDFGDSPSNFVYDHLLY